MIAFRIPLPPGLLTRGMLIALRVALAVCSIGIGLYVASMRSDAAIAAESSRYQPKCLSEPMRPGDSCTAVGIVPESSTVQTICDGNVTQSESCAHVEIDKFGTYEQMRAARSPDKLRAMYASRRRIGIGIAVLGVLIAGRPLWVVLSLFLRTRRGKEAGAQA